MAIFFGSYYSFGVFFKPLQDEFGWNRAMTSGAFSICTLTMMVFGTFSGWICDRFGPRVIIVGGSILVGLGLFLSSKIGTLWQLYLFYGVIFAFGLSTATSPLSSTISRWFIKRRGLALGVAAAGVGMGTLVISPLANHLIATFSWQTSYLIMAMAVWGQPEKGLRG